MATNPLGVLADLPLDIRRLFYIYYPARWTTLSKSFNKESQMFVDALLDSRPDIWELYLLVRDVKQICIIWNYHIPSIKKETNKLTLVHSRATDEEEGVEISSLSFEICELRKLFLVVDGKEKRCYLETRYTPLQAPCCVALQNMCTFLHQKIIEHATHFLEAVLLRRYGKRKYDPLRMIKVPIRIGRTDFDLIIGQCRLPFGVDELAYSCGCVLDGFIITTTQPSNELIKRTRDTILNQQCLDGTASLILLGHHPVYKSAHQIKDILLKLKEFGDQWGRGIRWMRLCEDLDNFTDNYADMVILLTRLRTAQRFLCFDIAHRIYQEITFPEGTSFGPIIDDDDLIMTNKWKEWQ